MYDFITENFSRDFLKRMATIQICEKDFCVENVLIVDVQRMRIFDLLKEIIMSESFFM